MYNSISHHTKFESNPFINVQMHASVEVVLHSLENSITSYSKVVSRYFE